MFGASNLLRSIKYKLLLLILPLCLLPLLGISAFSYYVAQKQITEDRIILYLHQIAENVADTIQLTLLEKKEETVSMTLFGEFRDFLSGRDSDPPQELLDKLALVHEVYDVIALFDYEGRLMLLNGINRSSRPDLIEYLDPDLIESLIGEDLEQFSPPASTWLRQVRSSRFGYIDWHISPLVNRLYDYETEDISLQYSVGFAAPVLDERNIVVGGVLALMNWSYVQEILDKVEEDFEIQSLRSGYAFLFGNDHNTIIGHKYRRNRNYPSVNVNELGAVSNNYQTRLVEDHKLTELYEAVEAGEPYLEYEYPPGSPKISGLAPIDHENFLWVCGVGINDEDIFAPVSELRTFLIWVASLSAVLVGLLTYTVARRLTIPIKKLTAGAKVVSGGDFSQRVEVPGKDEIAELAETFNEMAHSLEERSQALLELNRSLEQKVRERTRELEDTNQEVRRAYDKLKEAQFQLVQSEKMATLGQLVAGIAHEIKNPLNFIYGNTDFLKRYIQQLTELVELYEGAEILDESTRNRALQYKEDINYSFLLEDLQTLIQNFEEGAKRIHEIISDLRTFSRMESDEFRKVDLHDAIELSVSLLQNEYRGRVEIHRDFSDLPRVECHSGKMSQVFMNILSNACQAIEGAGEIRIRTLVEDRLAVVEIEDNGTGISRDAMERLFEPFFTTKAVGMGTGLGLSISYAIIQQHRGTIEVESEPGQGALFRVKIPIEQK